MDEAPPPDAVELGSDFTCECLVDTNSLAVGGTICFFLVLLLVMVALTLQGILDFSKSRFNQLSP